LTRGRVSARLRAIGSEESTVAARSHLPIALAFAFACALPWARAHPAPEEPRTRAVVQSTFQQGGQHYVRLQLEALREPMRMPFSTLAYRVQDPQMLEGLRPGDSVGFRAQRMDGENTVTAIGALPPCVRFQPCR
jgi:Cu/Ag efflux protein CusF